MTDTASRVSYRDEPRATAHRTGSYRVVANRLGHLRDHAMDRAQRTVRDVKRTAKRGQYALEDAADAARLGVRHYPARAVALAFLAGSVATVVAGLALRRRFGRG
jgi:hypothetical protein